MYTQKNFFSFYDEAQYQYFLTNLRGWSRVASFDRQVHGVGSPLYKHSSMMVDYYSSKVRHFYQLVNGGQYVY